MITSLGEEIYDNHYSGQIPGKEWLSNGDDGTKMEQSRPFTAFFTVCRNETCRNSKFQPDAHLFSNSVSIKMKIKSWRYGEFFQGKISTYSHKRPVLIHFLECIEKETQEEWLVDFYPRNGMTPGTVLAIDHKEQMVLCEIVGRKKAGRFVRLLNAGVDLTALCLQSEPLLTET